MGFSLQSSDCVEHSEDCGNENAASKRTSAAARSANTKEELAGVRPNSLAEREPQMNVLDHLIEVQAQIIRCRRLADKTPDRAMALRFYQLADNLEQRVREVDRALCSPE
jgi:hypothetical protein